ncbi:AGE family epimerase/isomerase [Flexivirga oryzae]|uniref:Mannose/cellobiose epimerase-like protein (N-acyl-D-glucosamine 2-epimerase family) n=1 Tax=Flexivirga oryzae TaxID=1794944 RepID=A0A839NHG8_9MICO|nr:AGE family epimerase/isomerase [Flexivirga oryzae]MBB2894111.1 mannose/cellobiose epimerase-like protein (N-acyl-D-glucosamine 2-epimerase family) [Flexivirga oryzae]
MPELPAQRATIRDVAPQLRAEADRLLDFALKSQVEHGFGWLDDAGGLLDRPLELWVTCRMTHSAALGLLTGRTEFAAMVDHGVGALRTAFRDAEHGGWFARIDAATGAVVDGSKEAYAHAFVLLAASSAVVAGRPGAAELLDEARRVHEAHFWLEAKTRVRESFSADWATAEPYLGINSVMHTVEAFLAVHDVTGETLYLDRAEAMTRQMAGWARTRDWRIPEHFDGNGAVLPEYNRDRPTDPFRPYGATVGHGLEWSRLALSVVAARRTRGASYNSDVLVAAATGLAERAVADGWAADGADGFGYTTDWAGRPVVRARLHWVVCEAIAAAYAMHEETGDERWAGDIVTWWRYAQQYLIDTAQGSWHHELSAGNQVAHETWEGKPDVYHALQMCLLVGDGLPLAPSFATALAARRRN